MSSTIQPFFRIRSTRAVFAAALAAIVAVLGATPAAPQVGKKKDHTTTTNQPTTNQPTTTAPSVATPSFLDDIFKKNVRMHDWLLRVSIHVDSYQDQSVYVQPSQIKPGGAPPVATQPGAGQTTPNGSMPEYTPFKFDSASIIFPAIPSTAGSTASQITASLKMDGRVVSSPDPTFLEDMPCGSRYAKWEMKSLEGRQLDFDVEITANCHELVFDEAKANKAIWPKSQKWPKEAASTFAPQMGVELTSPLLGEAINTWCAGKSPQTLSPVQLAKFIAGRVLEEIQPSGEGTISSRTGLLQGFELMGPEVTLQQKRGSEHDIACTLCALYRVAGLPARVVIGYDVSESKGKDLGFKRKMGGTLRSWVEFALVDETAKSANGEAKIAWVPVDVVRQRKSSNKAPPLDKPWKFFGSNEDTDSIIPIAFHYHPPTTVVAHGSPCFWGWITFPEMQQGAEQMVRFTTITPSKTAPPSTGGGGYK